MIIGYGRPATKSLTNSYLKSETGNAQEEEGYNDCNQQAVGRMQGLRDCAPTDEIRDKPLKPEVIVHLRRLDVHQHEVHKIESE